MKTVFLVFVVISLFSASLLLAAEPDPAAKAKDAATAWLALTDGGKYGESWDGAATLFKGAVTKDKWIQAITSARSPLGKMISRKVKSANPAKSLPGAPDGDYVVIQFDTAFENKAAAVETVTPMLEKDGTWKVAGYFIK